MSTPPELRPGDLLDGVLLFPLPNAVFFPHTLLPLHVFEPRYLALVEAAAGGPGLVGVPLLSGNWRERYYERPDVRPVFGVGRLVHREPAPEGRTNILLLGLARVRLAAEREDGAPYRSARVEVLDDGLRPGEELPLHRSLAAARQLFAALLRSLPGADPGRAEGLFDRARPAREILDVLCAAAPLSPAEKQGLLEELRPDVRAERLVELLAGSAAGPPADSGA